MLPSGWSASHSKSQNRTFYVHKETGRRQWHEPDTEVEHDKFLVRSFYSTLHQDTSPRTSWRSFNNFLKQAIMEECTSDLVCDYSNNFEYSVLDVGCGSGGDLGKWERLKATTYMGFDGCEQSIEALKKRSSSIKNLSCFCGDFTTPEAWEKVPSSSFDVISCQFSVHYAYADKYCARAFFQGVLKSLSPRGRLILVTVDSDWRHSAKRTWGPASMHACQETEKPYGDRYEFQLDSRVRAPEWWVHKQSLLADAAGLELCFEANLASFASFIGVGTTRSTCERQFHWLSSHMETLKAMCGTEPITADSWAVSSLYKVYVFRRPGLSCVNSLSKGFQSWYTAVKEGRLDQLPK